MIFGPPKDCSMMTLRPKNARNRVRIYHFRAKMFLNSPLGPSVTLTAFARTSTPLRMLALPSFENLISLCAPRVSAGLAALAAARRRDLDEVVDRRCIFFFEKFGKGYRRWRRKRAGRANFMKPRLNFLGHRKSLEGHVTAANSCNHFQQPLGRVS